MAEWFWVDGAQTSLVSADDRGLALADGIFETMRLEHGVLCLGNYHQYRLTEGLQRLAFRDPDGIAKQALEAVSSWALSLAADYEGSSLRLSITRGSGPRGYAPSASAPPRFIGRLSTGLPALQLPACAGVADIAWPTQPALSGLKLIARTEQVLAAQQLSLSGYDELLMANQRGAIVSTTSGNLFFRRGSQLVTPDLFEAGIAGTRRRYIIEFLAKACEMSVSVTDVFPEMLSEFEEAFFCNSIIGIRSLANVVYGDRKATYDSVAAAEKLRPAIHGMNH